MVGASKRDATRLHRSACQESQANSAAYEERRMGSAGASSAEFRHAACRIGQIPPIDTSLHCARHG